MTTLANGNYSLRASPALGLGGMYATGESEVDGAVTVSALGPNSRISQTWTIKAVEGEANLYTISQFTTGSTFGGALSVKDPKIPFFDNEPLVTSQSPDLWFISAVDVPDVEDAYEIIAKVPELGVEWLVGTHENDVVLKLFIVNQVPQHRPYWKIVAKSTY